MIQLQPQVEMIWWFHTQFWEGEENNRKQTELFFGLGSMKFSLQKKNQGSVHVPNLHVYGGLHAKHMGGVLNSLREKKAGKLLGWLGELLSNIYQLLLACISCIICRVQPAYSQGVNAAVSKIEIRKSRKLKNSLIIQYVPPNIHLQPEETYLDVCHSEINSIPTY